MHNPLAKILPWVVLILEGKDDTIFPQVLTLSKGIFLNERKSSDYGTWGKPNFRELRKGGNVLGKCH